MTTETQGAQTIDPLDLRNLIETTPAPVVGALPDGSVEFAKPCLGGMHGLLIRTIERMGLANHDPRSFSEDQPC
jgi:hypothetical protein